MTLGKSLKICVLVSKGITNTTYPDRTGMRINYIKICNMLREMLGTYKCRINVSYYLNADMLSDCSGLKHCAQIN